MAEALPKNFIDYEEYPQTADIQARCVSMIARLFNAPTHDDSETALGVSTVGSSEAIMLGTLAMKKKWQNKRKAEGKDYSKPNIIMNSAVQVCWEKAARYFEIEERYVFCTADRYVIDPVEAVDLVDENTIGICAIIGTTYTGEYEDVKAINDLLIERDIDCPIHVDAASGGFVAPFIDPDFVWDFRLEKVVSINVSGHKYGLVRTIAYNPISPHPPLPLPLSSSPPLPTIFISFCNINQILTNLFFSSHSHLGIPRRRMGHMALPRIPSPRISFHYKLPWRRPSLLHIKLLQRRLPNHRPILPNDPPRKKRLHLHHDKSNPYIRLLGHVFGKTRVHHHE